MRQEGYHLLARHEAAHRQRLKVAVLHIETGLCPTYSCCPGVGVRFHSVDINMLVHTTQPFASYSTHQQMLQQETPKSVRGVP